MIIYLYVKTHNVTGLKYLGKTIRKDPHKYPDSGTRWTSHLKVHGYDYTTTILKECTSNEEVKELGLYYSELWNVVDSDDWANLIAESGEGVKQTSESIAKGLVTKLAKYGTLNLTSPESVAKGVETKLAKYGTLNTITSESLAKCRVTKEANGTTNPNSPESIAKRLATMKANDSHKRSPETIEKYKLTRAKNKAAKLASS